MSPRERLQELWVTKIKPRLRAIGAGTADLTKMALGIQRNLPEEMARQDAQMQGDMQKLVDAWEAPGTDDEKIRRLAGALGEVEASEARRGAAKDRLDEGAAGREVDQLFTETERGRRAAKRLRDNDRGER